VGARGPLGAAGRPGPMTGRGGAVSRADDPRCPSLRHRPSPGTERSACVHRGPSGEARDTKRAGAAAGVEAGGEGFPRAGPGLAAWAELPRGAGPLGEVHHP